MENEAIIGGAVIVGFCAVDSEWLSIASLVPYLRLTNASVRTVNIAAHQDLPSSPWSLCVCSNPSPSSPSLRSLPTPKSAVRVLLPGQLPPWYLLGASSVPAFHITISMVVDGCRECNSFASPVVIGIATDFDAVLEAISASRNRHHRVFGAIVDGVSVTAELPCSGAAWGVPDLTVHARTEFDRVSLGEVGLGQCRGADRENGGGKDGQNHGEVE